MAHKGKGADTARVFGTRVGLKVFKFPSLPCRCNMRGAERSGVERARLMRRERQRRWLPVPSPGQPHDRIPAASARKVL